MTQAEKIIKMLSNKQSTLALAESCTGGLVSSQLTDIPGSSAVFKGSIIAYSNETKEKALNVPSKTLKKFGAVSSEVALCMAKGVRLSLNTTFGIGISGIAGPDGGTKSKPVGLVFIAVAKEDEAICLKCQFDGTRSQIKLHASKQALKLLEEFLTH